MITRVTILVLLANFLALTYANANSYLLQRDTCASLVNHYLASQKSQGYLCKIQSHPARVAKKDSVILSYVYQCQSKRDAYIVKLDLDLKRCDLEVNLLDEVPQNLFNSTKSDSVQTVE